jgi:predicted peptidase
MLLMLSVLTTIQKQYNIDPNRLYIAGQSDGGFGVWNLITLRPELFAAAIVLCGGGNPENADHAAKTPVWVFHGEQDDTVPVQEARKMVDALRKAGGKPRYTEYKDVGHNVWNRALGESGLADWLFAQHK